MSVNVIKSDMSFSIEVNKVLVTQSDAKTYSFSVKVTDDMAMAT